jgi:SAM-dependent methyltransferase
MAKRYIASPIGDSAAYEHKLALTRKHLRPDMDVLEIGCGSGNTGRLHAPLVKSYRAIDLSPRMVELGKAEGPIPGNMMMEAANFDEIDVAHASLDAVLALSVLHLVPDPAATIAKVRKCLKPGGVFVTSTACLKSMWPLRLLAPIGRVTGLIPPLAFFSEHELRAMMAAAGFEIVEDWRATKRAALFLVARVAD